MWGALASIAGSVIGGLFSSKGASDQNKAAAQLSQENRDFQERMSSTAVQRRTADLRLAGINPILAAGQAATAPAGNVAPVVNELEGAATSARQISTDAANLANMRETNKLIKAQIFKSNAETDIVKANLNSAKAAAIVPGATLEVYDKIRKGDLNIDTIVDNPMDTILTIMGLRTKAGARKFIFDKKNKSLGKSKRKNPTKINVGKKNKITAGSSIAARKNRIDYNKSLKSGKYYTYPKSNTF